MRREPTKRQLEYAGAIARELHMSEEKIWEQPSVDAFIKTYQQDYYRSQRERIVKSVPITDYAESQGYHLVRKGRYYALKEHDSVRIDPDRNWYWRNSESGTGTSIGKGGSVIDFAMNFKNISAAEAMKELKSYLGESWSGSESQVKMAAKNPVEQEKKRLQLPEPADNMHRVYAYLIKTRGIDPDIVNQFVRSKNLYQDVHGNCVFVSYDVKDDGSTGEPVFACMRGTNTYKKFIGDVYGCDYKKGYFVEGNTHSDKLIITESVIDAMSVMSVLKQNYLDHRSFHYLPMAGVGKEECISKKISQKGIREVYLALDNDSAGRKAAEQIKEHLMEQGMQEQRIHECFPDAKDWNEEIQTASNEKIMKDALAFYPSGTEKCHKMEQGNQSHVVEKYMKSYTRNCSNTLQMNHTMEM